MLENKTSVLGMDMTCNKIIDKCHVPARPDTQTILSHGLRTEKLCLPEHADFESPRVITEGSNAHAQQRNTM